MDYAIDNLILIGDRNYPLYRFDNSTIVLNSINGVFSVDTIGNELSVDTFAFTVRYDPTAIMVYGTNQSEAYELEDNALYKLATAEGRAYMTELSYGTPVFWYCGGDFFTKAYLRQVERVGKYAWRLTCVSGVGLLDDDNKHPGDVYTGEAFADVAADIIGETFNFTVSDVVATLPVVGWLPYDNRRANLHRLLFAYGAALLRYDADTDYNIGFLVEASAPPGIGPERVSIAGKTSYTLPATMAEVTEHSYFEAATAAAETLYDNINDAEVSGLTVVFGGPYYDLSATTGLTIEESGVNYAVISGVGILTGKPYAHSSTLVRLGDSAQMVKRVTADNGLISALNSRNIAKRVLAYYQAAKTIEVKMLLNQERCGLVYNLTDAFGETSAAFLQRMNVTPTSLLAATCEFVAGYTPTGQGLYYNNRVLINTPGAWVVPADVTSLHIVLIGGGTGGNGGYDGADGYTPAYEVYDEQPTGFLWAGWEYYRGNQSTPTGGAAGAGGSSGKVNVLDIVVTPGSTLQVFPGAGGTGGATNGGIGSDGAATTLTGPGISASSDDGQTLVGYTDPFTGDLYASEGAAGTPGGDGGRTDETGLYGWNGAFGLPGAEAGNYSGGAGGAGVAGGALAGGIRSYRASGGGGGGAAYGADGGNGVAGQYIVVEAGDHASIRVYGGAGGDGADAAAPALAAYGCGGNGGHGGGAGGNGGGSFYNATIGGHYAGAGGTGGRGSAGGNGGAGCVLIYY